MSESRSRERPVRKRLFHVLIVVAVGGIAFFFGSRGVDISGAKSEARGRTEDGALVGFQPSYIDLGERAWNVRIPTQLEFVNLGRQAITIESVESSCDCVLIEKASFRGVTVNARERLPIDVEFHTEANPGAKRRRITLRDVYGSAWTATIDVAVKGTWSLSADVVDFGDVVMDGGEPIIHSAVTYTSAGDRLESVAAAPSVAWLSVNQGLPEGGKAQILLTVRKDRLSEGVHSTSVLVRTSNEVKPTGVIFVKLRAVYLLTCSPSQVMLVGDRPVRVEFYDCTGSRASVTAAEAQTGTVVVNLLEDGAIEIANLTGQPFAEPARIQVTDSRGRSRVILVPAM